MSNNPFQQIGLTASELKQIALIRAVKANDETYFETYEEQAEELENLDIIRREFIDGMRMMIRFIPHLQNKATAQKIYDGMHDAINMIVLDTIDPEIEAVKDCEISYPICQIYRHDFLNEVGAA